MNGLLKLNPGRNTDFDMHSSSSFRLQVIPFLIIFSLISFVVIPVVFAEDLQQSSATVREGSISFSMEFLFDEPLDDGVLTLYPGDHYYFYVRLTNDGTVNDSYQLEITGIPSGWEVLFSNKDTSTEVFVKESSTGDNTEDVLVVVGVPESAKKDDNADLDFSATSVASQGTPPTIIKTLDLLININYLPPHILLETGTPEKVVTPGGAPVSFSIQVKNLGYENVDYYPPDTADFSLDDVWTVSIPDAGKAINLDPAALGSFVINVSAASGTGVSERLKLEIKGQTSSAETTILPVELVINVKQVHNLQVTGPAEKTVLTPLKNVAYEITIQNNGNGPETLALRLDVPDSVSGWNVIVSDSSLIIPASGQYTIDIDFSPTEEAQYGQYKFEFHADIMDSSTVIQTVSSTTNVEIQYVPDLAISDSDVKFSTGNIEPDQTILINATVHNDGIVPAFNVSVSFTLTTKGGSQKVIGTVEIPQIAPDSKATAIIEWTVDPSTSSITVSVDPQDNTKEIDEYNNNAFQSVFIIPPVVQPSKDSGSDGIGISGIGSAGAIIVLTALISITSVIALVTLNSEAGRYGFFSFFAPLYSKMRREDILLHETREMVYDYVKTHPGEHFRSIMNKLSLTNGTLAHHLYTLEKQEFIKSERDGPYKRFYPQGYVFTDDVMEVNGLQKKILDSIETSPGISQKGLAKILNISPPTVNYHIKTLVGARLVELQRNGKETRCYRIKAE